MKAVDEFNQVEVHQINIEEDFESYKHALEQYRMFGILRCEVMLFKGKLLIKKNLYEAMLHYQKELFIKKFGGMYHDNCEFDKERNCFKFSHVHIAWQAWQLALQENGLL